MNPDFVRVARQIVADAPDLSAKQPAIRHAPEFLQDLPPFDMMLFFSVLNFCSSSEREQALSLARSQKPDAMIWITHAHWIDRLDPAILTDLRITRIMQTDLPEALRITDHGWSEDDVSKVFPIICLQSRT